jgi:hypothetical protein
LTTLEAINKDAGDVLDVGASAYVYDPVTGVIKIILVYK